MRETAKCSCGGSLSLCRRCVRDSREPLPLIRSCRWLAMALIKSLAWLVVTSGLRNGLATIGPAIGLATIGLATIGFATIGLVLVIVPVVVRPAPDLGVEGLQGGASVSASALADRDFGSALAPAPSVSAQPAPTASLVPERLSELANAPHASSRLQAAQYLAASDDPTTVDQLVAAMPAAPASARARIVWVLGQRTDGAAGLSCLISAATEDPSPLVRQEAIRSLEVVGLRVIPVLRTAQRRESHEHAKLAEEAHRAARHIESRYPRGLVR
jgi:hypothetical protein